MKSKRSFVKIARIALCVMLMSILAATLFACAKDGKPTLSVKTDVEEGAELQHGGSVNFTVTVSDGSDYTIAVDKTDIAKIDGDTLIITKEVSEETVVKVTVTLNKDKSVSVSKTFRVMPKEVVPTVTLTASKASNAKISKGDEISFTAYTSNGADVLFKTDKPELVEFDGNTMKVTAEVQKVTIITVTAYISDRPECYAVRSFRIMPKQTSGTVIGQAYELNKDAMDVIANENITAKGVVTDVFENLKTSTTTRKAYDFTVKMSDGAWYGAWNKQLEDEDDYANVLVSNYRIGVDYFWKDQGVGGHLMNELFVNKNNVADSRVVKDYKSVPAMWEEQHLWNHISNLDINKFESVEFNEAGAYEVFRYNCKYINDAGNEVMSEADAYLMTYLSFCFTPMMEETIDILDFVVKIDENGKFYVSEIRMQTESELGYESTSATTTAKVVSRGYTTVQFTMADAGTTVVPSVEPYEDEMPEMTQYLKDALETIKGQTNYVFEAEDSGVADYNPEDYGYADADDEVTQIKNHHSSTGTVGYKGYVTADAILLEKTFKYSAYMEGSDPYRITYTGYKKTADNAYDEFEYDSSVGKMAGTRRMVGTIAENVIPKWNFSESVFEYSHTVAGKVNVDYVFMLRDLSIMRAVAKEVTMLSEADNTVSASNSMMLITVTYNKNTKKTRLKSVSFPYESGQTSGTLTISFKQIGASADEIMPAGAFKNGYQQKEIVTSWSQLTINDYYYLHKQCTGITATAHGDTHPYGCDYIYDADGNIKTDENGITMSVHRNHVVSADYAISQMFGDKKVISPEVLFTLFNGNVHGPWYDDKVVGKDASNKDVYRVQLKLSAKIDCIDENGQLLDDEYEAFMTNVTSKLAEAGFALSTSNSNWDGVNSVKGSFEKTRYMTYTNNETMIVFENIHSGYMYIHIYAAGEWTLLNK